MQCVLTFCSQSSLRSSLWGEILSHSSSKRPSWLTAWMLGRPPSITWLGSTVSSFTLQRNHRAHHNQNIHSIGPLGPSTVWTNTQDGGIMNRFTTCMDKDDCWLCKYLYNFCLGFHFGPINMVHSVKDHSLFRKSSLDSHLEGLISKSVWW